MNSSLRTMLVSFGSIMVVMGAVVLMFLGVMCYLAVMAPEKVTIVQFIMEHVQQGDRAFYGQIKDRTTGRIMDFELEMTETARSISFLFMGIGLMGVLALILRVLIASGVQLIKLGTDNTA